MKIKGVIFDHDGTLVDSERFHYRIWSALLASYGINFPERDYIEQHSGVPTYDNAVRLVSDYSLQKSAEELCREKELLTDKHFSRHGTSLMPDVEACLTHCHKLTLKLAIATGASASTIAHSIEKRVFYPLFSAVVTRDDVKHPKPAPDVYALASRKLGLKPDQCLAVEDSPTGIASAKAAGITCIAIPNSYSRHQDLSQADYHVENLSALMPLISKLIK